MKRLSGQDNIVTIPKLYIELTGDLTTALVLNQIVFWSDKSKRTDGFFYKSYKEWQDETLLTERQVRYSVKKLKEYKFVETKLKKANGAPTLHYKLDFDNLLDSIMTNCKIPNLQIVGLDSYKMSESDSYKMSETLTDDYTENTTENTTDIKNNVTNVPANKIPYKEIIDYLNSKAGTNYRSTGNKTRSCIKARWNEQFTLNDFKTVIDNKVSDANNPRDLFQAKYLRPETLFGSKFESYLNQKGGAYIGKTETSEIGGVKVPF